MLRNTPQIDRDQAVEGGGVELGQGFTVGVLRRDSRVVERIVKPAEAPDGLGDEFLDARDADQVAEDLLRMFGVPAGEAHQICQRPLPDPGDLPRRGTAA
jgi:hypothetical protein